MFKNIHEYNSLIDRIEACVDWYEGVHMQDTRFKLYLANNDELDIDFNKNSISHLLGINIEFLRSTGLYQGSSFNILNDILYNPQKLYNQIRDGYINKNNVFSKYIDKKLDNFKNICGVNIFNIEFIVKYKSDRSFCSDDMKLDGDYYIAYRSNYDTLSIVGFKKNERLYYPLTNVELKVDEPETIEFLNRLLKNQTVTCAQTLKKNTFIDYALDKKPFYYNNEDKQRKLKTLERYSEDFGCEVNTNNAFIYYINKVQNLYDEKSNIWNIINDITKAIDNKELISITKLEEKYGVINNNLVGIISAHNDSLVNKNNEGSNHSYKDIIEGFKSAKEEVERLTNLAESLDEKNKALSLKVMGLEEKNSEYEKNEEKIREIVCKNNK